MSLLCNKLMWSKHQNRPISMIQNHTHPHTHTYACTHTITMWTRIHKLLPSVCFSLVQTLLHSKGEMTNLFCWTLCGYSVCSTAFTSIHPLLYKLSNFSVFADQNNFSSVSNLLSEKHRWFQTVIPYLKGITIFKKRIHLICRVDKVLSNLQPWEGLASFHATS